MTQNGKNTILLEVNNISKSYSLKKVLSDVSFSAMSGEIIGLVGRNGAGKSTLLRIMCGNLSPSSGEVLVSFSDGSKKNIVDAQSSFHWCGFAAPYLELNDEFTPLELLEQTCLLKGMKYNHLVAVKLLESLGLDSSRNDSYVQEFSSGMRQRVQLACALISPAFVLGVDEPTTNLDESGISKIHTALRGFAADGGIVVIASNDERDIAICTRTYSVI